MSFILFKEKKKDVRALQKQSWEPMFSLCSYAIGQTYPFQFTSDFNSFLVRPSLTQYSSCMSATKKMKYSLPGVIVIYLPAF